MPENVKKLIIYAIGIFCIFAITEVFLRFRYRFIPFHLENNSYLIKKKLANDSTDAQILFIGSSGFARGIDCQLIKTTPKCINLSVDGGDSETYHFTLDQYLKENKAPPFLVFEIAELTFDGQFDASVPIKTFINNDWFYDEIIKRTGITNEGKQAFRNRIDQILFPFAINHFSRRKRFSEWPNIFSKRESVNINNQIKSIIALQSPSPKKVDHFLKAIDLAIDHNMKIGVVWGPFKEGGYINPSSLKQSSAYQILSNLDKEQKIQFIDDLNEWGMQDDYFSDSLLHFKMEKVPWFTEKMIKEVTDVLF